MTTTTAMTSSPLSPHQQITKRRQRGRNNADCDDDNEDDRKMPANSETPPSSSHQHQAQSRLKRAKTQAENGHHRHRNDPAITTPAMMIDLTTTAATTTKNASDSTQPTTTTLSSNMDGGSFRRRTRSFDTRSFVVCARDDPAPPDSAHTNFGDTVASASALVPVIHLEEVDDEDDDEVVVVKVSKQEQTQEPINSHTTTLTNFSTSTTILDRAWKLVERVLAVERQIHQQFPANVQSTGACVAADDMVFMAQKTLELQATFRAQHKPTFVDIGYHYTQPDYLARIRTTGLLTKAEREQRSIASNYNGSAMGEGIYTANDAVFAGMTGMYGNTGILVARLRGVESTTMPVAHMWGGGGYHYPHGQQPEQQQPPSYDHDTYISDNIAVLRDSAQCLALVQFDRAVLVRAAARGGVGIAQEDKNDDDTGHGGGRRGRDPTMVNIVHAYHVALQRVMDEFFNQGQQQATPVPPPVANRRVMASLGFGPSSGAGPPPPPPLAPTGVVASGPPTANRVSSLSSSLAGPLQRGSQMTAGSAAAAARARLRAPAAASAAAARARLRAAAAANAPAARARLRAAGKSVLQPKPTSLTIQRRMAFNNSASAVAAAAAARAHFRATGIVPARPVPPLSTTTGSGAAGAVAGRSTMMPQPRRTIQYTAPSTLAPPTSGGMNNSVFELVQDPSSTVSSDSAAAGGADGEKECPICMSLLSSTTTGAGAGYNVTDQAPVVRLKACGHLFHLDCLQTALQHANRCPVCRKAAGGGGLRGTMPSGTMTISVSPHVTCQGYDPASDDDDGGGSIILTYVLPAGIQKTYHPAPGERHGSAHRTAYLPNTAEGRQLLSRLQYAFRAGLTFTVGTSLTTQEPNSITWSSIHHKTSPSGGVHGFPDVNYLDNTNAELDNLGVPAAADLLEEG